MSMDRNRTCCKKYFDTEYNYCPECGFTLRLGGYNKTQPPTISEADNLGDVRESHPAYGQLLFSRRSSNKSNQSTLYGSSIRHQNTIIMQVVDLINSLVSLVNVILVQTFR